MEIWKTIKAAFGTAVPPDARRLNAVGRTALSASLGALADEETGWITLSEARALFGEMDQIGKASLVAFAEEREHRSPKSNLTRAHPDAATRRIRVRCISKRRTEPGSTRQFAEWPFGHQSPFTLFLVKDQDRSVRGGVS